MELIGIRETDVTHTPQLKTLNGSKLGRIPEPSFILGDVKGST